VNAADRTIPIQPAPPVADASGEVALYEIRQKIYPRAVTGRFAQWRWALIFATQIIFYGLPWLFWNGRQAVLFDIAARKFYILGLVFWPQDVIYLSVLLILSALTLFLATAMAGRVWCGYACPQTVYTEVFLWIERKIEGDRAARIRLDREPMSAAKVGKKAAKHGVWIALSVWTGITFVGYFTPFRPLLAAIPGGLGGWEIFWILFYGAATYGNAGWMREQVCKYMCPYARFQSVMFDKDTLVITYDPGRGEPRGARSRKADIQAAGLGHCVDCSICVQVCPTGIDIRKGLQYECIGCAACIDGCNQVMDKMGYPQGLIRYTTENALAKGYDSTTIVKRVFRFRTLLYLALLTVIAVAAGVSLALKNPLKVDVIRDRGALAREAAPGVIENVYRLQIMNTDERPHQFTVTASGLPGLRVVGVEQPVTLAGATARLLPVRLQIAADGEEGGETKSEHGHDGERHNRTSHKIEITVQATDDPGIVRREKSSFLFLR
jgi:cytochrome c oxidase accessory protein FixG